MTDIATVSFRTIGFISYLQLECPQVSFRIAGTSSRSPDPAVSVQNRRCEFKPSKLSEGILSAHMDVEIV